MALEIKLDVTDKGLKAIQALMEPANVRKQVTAGMRYASNGLARTLAKEIGTRYAISAARIKKDIRKPTVSQQGVTIKFSTLAPTLRGYSGKPLSTRLSRRGNTVSTGISFKVFKRQAEKRPSVFWMIPRNTDVSAPGIPVKRIGSARTQIETQYGPSIGKIVTGSSKHGPAIIKATTEQTMIQLLKGIERERARQARTK